MLASPVVFDFRPGHVPVTTCVETGSLTAPARTSGVAICVSAPKAGWSARPAWRADGVGALRPGEVGGYVFTAST